jgi:hypothetical protein
VEVDENTERLPDIPIDPINKRRRWNLANFGKKIGLLFQAIGYHLSLPLLLAGLSMTLTTILMGRVNLFYWIMLLIYIAFILLHFLLKPKKYRPWGLVYQVENGSAVSLVPVQLIDKETGRVVKSRLSDYQGRYNFLAEKGQYELLAGSGDFHMAKKDKKGRLFRPDFTLKQKNSHIHKDIPLKKDDSLAI